MLRQLRPISDLQRVVGFDDFDLNANRIGVLSARQRLLFIAARLRDHFLGALTVIFVLMWLELAARYTPPVEVNSLAVTIIAIVTLILFILRIRPAFQKSVTVQKGQVNKSHTLPLGGVRLEEIMIGAARFFVPYHISDILEEEAVYQAYYLERKPFIGGNKLLAVEFIEHAPEEDEE